MADQARLAGAVQRPPVDAGGLGAERVLLPVADRVGAGREQRPEGGEPAGRRGGPAGREPARPRGRPASRRPRPRQAAVALALAALSCGPATGGDASFWAPREGAAGQGEGGTSAAGGAGAGGEGGAAGQGGSGQASGGQAGGGQAGGGQAGAGGGCLRVRLTTVTDQGEFAPRNVGAIWVTRADGQFVRTLQLWGNKRVEHLLDWGASSGGNVVDAVTSATLKKHVAHDVSWDCLDALGAASPPGDYRVRVEFTESNSSDKGEPPGPTASWPFTLGAGPLDQALPDQPGFTGAHLSQP